MADDSNNQRSPKPPEDRRSPSLFLPYIDIFPRVLQAPPPSSNWRFELPRNMSGSHDNVDEHKVDKRTFEEAIESGKRAYREAIITSNKAAEAVWNSHLAELEQWAEANRKEARNDAMAFWALKIPAIVASASAGIWAHFNLITVSVIAGAIASLCVIIDGIHPRGMLRNTHLRAFHDLRILISRMTSQLRSSSGQPENTVRKIIRESEPERVRIATYIRDAETALKPGGEKG